MKPIAWRLTWIDPDGSRHTIEHAQRAHIRGLRMMRLACGCTDVVITPIFRD